VYKHRSDVLREIEEKLYDPIKQDVFRDFVEKLMKEPEIYGFSRYLESIINTLRNYFGLLTEIAEKREDLAERWTVYAENLKNLHKKLDKCLSGLNFDPVCTIFYAGFDSVREMSPKEQIPVNEVEETVYRQLEKSLRSTSTYVRKAAEAVIRFLVLAGRVHARLEKLPLYNIKALTEDEYLLPELKSLYDASKELFYTIKMPGEETLEKLETRLKELKLMGIAIAFLSLVGIGSILASRTGFFGLAFPKGLSEPFLIAILLAIFILSIGFGLKRRK